MITSEAKVARVEIGFIQPYSLSSDAFRQVPDEIVRNPTFNRVTRDNFTHTMINTFSYSRGLIGAHIMEFDWMAVNNGFDYITTLQNFVDAGGVDVLTKEEKDEVVLSYRKAKEHIRYRSVNQQQQMTDEEILKNFSVSLSEFGTENINTELEDFDEEILFLYNRIGEIRGMGFNEFIKKLHSAVLELKSGAQERI